MKLYLIHCLIKNVSELPTNVTTLRDEIVRSRQSHRYWCALSMSDNSGGGHLARRLVTVVAHVQALLLIIRNPQNNNRLLPEFIDLARKYTDTELSFSE